MWKQRLAASGGAPPPEWLRVAGKLSRHGSRAGSRSESGGGGMECARGHPPHHATAGAPSSSEPPARVEVYDLSEDYKGPPTTRR